MLTREEQESVMAKVRVIRSQDARLRKMVAHHEISPRRYREWVQRSEEELRDLLKELG